MTGSEKPTRPEENLFQSFRNSVGTALGLNVDLRCWKEAFNFLG
jgi:hypothetical protein